MFNSQLILEDGTIYKGYSFGSKKECIGEVVFNTSMVGYQETLSDPSYNGQIITFTYPLIGNYGINREDFESMRLSVKGVIIKEPCSTPSNFRNEINLEELLKEHNIPGIYGIDTRSLTKKIRTKGVIKGCIVPIDQDVDKVIEYLKNTTLPTDQIKQVSTKSTSTLIGRGHRVVLVDLGMKAGIMRELTQRNCDVITVPYNISAEEIIKLKPDGIMLTNGPGDPQDVPETVETIKQLIGKIPIFGICMGHQLLALAGGAKTYKLKFGHRGCNHPVKNLITGKVDITSQNHGYSVDIDSLKSTEFELTHIAINDKTCEGIRHKKYPIFSVQYHPEASPGPHDSTYLFDQFIENMKEFKEKV